MAINKVKYGEYMISLLRCHTGRGQGEPERGEASANDIGGGRGLGPGWGQCPSGPIVVNRKLKTAIK